MFIYIYINKVFFFLSISTTKKKLIAAFYLTILTFFYCSSAGGEKSAYNYWDIVWVMGWKLAIEWKTMNCEDKKKKITITILIELHWI